MSHAASSSSSSAAALPSAAFHQHPDPRPHPERIFLFDVDGTLTEPRKLISPKTEKFMEQLRKRVRCGVVGGSDLHKVQEQLGANMTAQWDYVFVENGLLAYKHGKQIAVQSLKNFLGEEKIKKLVNFCLHYIADLDIPIKRGTFVEFRNGMINVSPIGRNCSQSERDDFEKYDHEKHIRVQFIEQLKKHFPDYHLVYSIGGQISFDAFPVGWDKTYCLQYLEKDGLKEIHFFGDKTFKGGNDYEIYESEKTVGHTVKNPEDTMKQINDYFAAHHEPTIEVE